MTNGELIELLQGLPPEFPVFFCTDEIGRKVIAPKDAVMNLVDPAAGEVISDNDQSSDINRFVDSIVIYSRNVRDE